ncbi:MAG: c-type cytochrome [Verrucomicrobia bacterium]|nr:c-type cytochrome [Verrucomicrobiota bacterium]
MGDRGFDTRGADGQRIHQSHRGGVFRCFPDGSALELFHEGLRNPQEIAFNWRGDLFTVDNNMSGGDECRVIHILEGADSGWQAEYQLERNFREETAKEKDPTNPWFFEFLWQTNHIDQPHWVHRPMAHLTRGPSGLAYVPGAVAPPEWRDHFLISDFVGSPANSFILAFQAEPIGATYNMSSSRVFLQGILSTDQTFGPDGALYIADFINGWSGLGSGKIHRLAFPSHQSTEEARAAINARSQWTPPDHSDPIDFLAAKLSADDWDARLLAQWKLADAGQRGLEAFVRVLQSQSSKSAKMHALWGLGMLAQDPSNQDLIAPIIHLALESEDPDLVEVATRVAGDVIFLSMETPLVRNQFHNSPRVQVASVMALSRWPHLTAQTRQAFIRWARSHRTLNDQAVKNAVVSFLFRQFSPGELVQELARDPQESIRLAVALALRRHKSPFLAHSLNDPDPSIALEAARAIHDLRILEAMPTLARHYLKPEFNNLPDSWKRRVLNANFILASPFGLENIISICLNSLESHPELASEAVEYLEEWDQPSPFDNVTWQAWPEQKRSLAPVNNHLKNRIQLAFDGSQDISSSASQVLLRLALATGCATPAYAADFLAQPDLNSELKKKILEYLTKSMTSADQLQALHLPPAIQTLAIVSLIHKGMLDPDSDDPVYMLPWQENFPMDIRNLILQLLKAEFPQPHLSRFIESALNRALTLETSTTWMAPIADLAHKSNSPSHQSLLETWNARLNSKYANSLGTWNLALDGGEPANGRWLFFNHAAQCIRCHSVEDAGGQAGPALGPILQTKSATQILRSILSPSEEISPGFGIATIKKSDGSSLTGIYKAASESSTTLTISDEFGQLTDLIIPGSQISEISFQPSSMPNVMDVLNRTQVRDLIAFLQSIK